MLNFTRTVLALRKANPALHHGEILQCKANGDLLDMIRQADGQTLRCLFNIGPDPLPLDEDNAGEIIFAIPGSTLQFLAPFGALIFEETSCA